jgi:glutamate-1-semialdehyde 2,1-aminomutase
MQVGTLSGNPVAATAGLKTLEILKRPGAYELIFKNGRTLMEGYRDILADAGLHARVVGEAPLFDLVFTEREVTDYRSMIGDQDTMKRCNGLLRERGILKGESKYYISLAHTDEDIRFTLDVFASAIGELARMRAA